MDKIKNALTKNKNPLEKYKNYKNNPPKKHKNCPRFSPKKIQKDPKIDNKALIGPFCNVWDLIRNCWGLICIFLGEKPWAIFLFF
jgi:hypothetical protein